MSQEPPTQSERAVPGEPPVQRKRTSTRTLLGVLQRVRAEPTNERAVQDAIERALALAGIAFVREAQLGEGDRIDFLVGHVGVEVKTQGGVGEIHRQLLRYARRPQIRALILVSTRAVIARGAPVGIGRKPVHVVTLGYYL